MTKNNTSSANAEETLELQNKKFRKELNAGTSALILLSLLRKAGKPLYGYEISKLLEKNASDKQGAIYPVLRNMVSKGLLEVDVKPSDSGPPRKYFSISPLGRTVLQEWIKIWAETKNIVDFSISETPIKSDQGND
ncbi:PadR family transcriptional regulator [Kordiimonas sediminis]|uniref:PadR family transcriptional regulator n=1 Tax=Kordiimonas sediminis TaxID=1735581 RepID=A0A919E4F0_9PROT|nr:PadR family transcriptional regulator [Kordiimonas sediminis]GHF11151.1 PadR family transcriptional regulator [Kordiimonas sediminis]